VIEPSFMRALAFAALAGAFASQASPSNATPLFANETNLDCLACHNHPPVGRAAANDLTAAALLPAATTASRAADRGQPDLRLVRDFPMREKPGPQRARSADLFLGLSELRAWLVLPGDGALWHPGRGGPERSGLWRLREVRLLSRL